MMIMQYINIYFMFGYYTYFVSLKNMIPQNSTRAVHIDTHTFNINVIQLFNKCFENIHDVYLAWFLETYPQRI